MAADPNMILVLVVLFFSSFTRAAFGFGDALLAMPLLAMLVGVRTAAPLVALVAGTLSLTILLSSWRNVRLASAGRLVAGALAGIPLGLWFLRGAHETLLKLALAMVLIGYSLTSLIRPRLPRLESDRAAFGFGFAGGLLGGAYNTNGPAVVIYGLLRRWSPASFRATLQGYFLPSGLLILTGHGVSGLWTSRVLQLFLMSLPVVLAAVWLGGLANRRIPSGRFDRVVYGLLLLIGSLLLVQALTGE